MISRLIDWLKGKSKECRHPNKKLTEQPYDGVAWYQCPAPPDGCGALFWEYDRESDQDPDVSL